MRTAGTCLLILVVVCAAEVGAVGGKVAPGAASACAGGD